MKPSFTHEFNNYTNRLKHMNPQFLIVFVLVFLIFLAFLATLNGGSTPTDTMGNATPSSNGGMAFIEIIMWVIVLFLVLINGIQYLFEIDVKASFKNLFTTTPELDIFLEKKKMKNDKLPGIPGDRFLKQVFHIPDNKYTYNDAKAVCKAFNSKLASYDQIESAYNNGAEWCSYGWSDDQMVYFPTQKGSYNKLKKIQGHKNDCGRPGINGGFIDNPNAEFGVNCYGVKPNITDEEQMIMKTQNIYPKTKSDKKLENKVEEFRKNISNILLSPFNTKSWSRI